MSKRNSHWVAFQGERGAYSEIAARRFFGEGIKLLPRESFDLVFKSVESQKADAGIVPIENSQAGCIHQNYDLLLKHRLRIVGELNLRVEHNLIGHPGTALGSIQMIFSHPQALMQCQGSTAKLKGVKIIAAYDTAGSVKKIKEEKLLNAGAIASELAAEIYGMKILKKGIQDNPENFTRFLVLRKTQKPPRGANKTSLVFSLMNVPGALFRSLSAFALRDIDLYKIESRPLHGTPWEYFFYIDFAGSPSEPNCRNALENLREIATFMKVLGSYPRDARKP